MSDAAVKVDPEFYNARLLETESNGQPQRVGANFGGGGGSGGGGRGGNFGGLPDLPDYLVRQHSLLGFYLSLNAGDEGRSCVRICTAAHNGREGYRVVCPHMKQGSCDLCASRFTSRSKKTKQRLTLLW